MIEYINAHGLIAWCPPLVAVFWEAVETLGGGD
jgi:hypothetical protein